MRAWNAVESSPCGMPVALVGACAWHAGPEGMVGCAFLGARVYPHRGQDLVSKPVCHWGKPSKLCKLEMSSMLLNVIDSALMRPTNIPVG